MEQSLRKAVAPKGKDNPVHLVSPAGKDGTAVKVIGVGGAGGNAVSNMVEDGSAGVAFITANTDRQALEATLAPTRLRTGAVDLRAHHRLDVRGVRALHDEQVAEVGLALQGAHHARTGHPTPAAQAEERGCKPARRNDPSHRPGGQTPRPHGTLLPRTAGRRGEGNDEHKTPESGWRTPMSAMTCEHDRDFDAGSMRPKRLACRAENRSPDPRSGAGRTQAPTRRPRARPGPSRASPALSRPFRRRCGGACPRTRLPPGAPARASPWCSSGSRSSPPCLRQRGRR